MGTCYIPKSYIDIIYACRILPGQVKFQVGDRVKGVQIPSTHPNYKWKAVSVNMLSINKKPVCLFSCLLFQIVFDMFDSFRYTY